MAEYVFNSTLPEILDVDVTNVTDINELKNNFNQLQHDSEVLIASMHSLTERLNWISHNVDSFFLITNGIIIYFMQCGFALIECGSVRSKNATNIIIKNILDSFIGALAWWLIGWSLAFGEGNGFCGSTYFAAAYLPPSQFPMWFFQFVFASTSATIVSGALAERCEFHAYMVYSVVITGFVYPIVTHWAWSDHGWLAIGLNITHNNETVNIRYMDFAGCGPVHLLGGTAALVGAVILGPRIGRFRGPRGKKHNIPGHSVPLAAMGGFVLFFGFFAFNSGSQGHISQPGDAEAIGRSVVNTMVSASSAAIVGLSFHYGFSNRGDHPQRHWSLLVTINSGLCGMAAITAGGNTFEPWAAAVVGSVAGLGYLIWSKMLLRLGVDDPLDAVAVHACSGLWGLIAAPIFCSKVGLIYSPHRPALVQLGWNIAGALATIAWSAGCCIPLFGILRLLGWLRVDENLELRGLDVPIHNEPAYPVESYGDGWQEFARRRASQIRVNPTESSTRNVTQRVNGARRRCHPENGQPNSGFEIDEIFSMPPMSLEADPAPAYDMPSYPIGQVSSQVGLSRAANFDPSPPEAPRYSEIYPSSIDEAASCQSQDSQAGQGSEGFDGTGRRTSRSVDIVADDDASDAVDESQTSTPQEGNESNAVTFIQESERIDEANAQSPIPLSESHGQAENVTLNLEPASPEADEVPMTLIDNDPDPETYL